MTMAEFLERTSLAGLHRSGPGCLARCPSHADRSPSLSISEGDDGRILLHCWAGCRTADVVAALGLGFADLFPGSGRSGRR